MKDFVYNSMDRYFNTLEATGYVKQKDVDSLLILNFIYKLIYQDYRGYVNSEDYRLFERALNCLYGTNCLIPYPDYLKMGKLYLGEITELTQRVKTLEETEVVRSLEENNDESDIQIIVDEN